MMLSPERVEDRDRWNRILTTLPGCHLLQSWEWGQLKEKYGWQASRILWTNHQGQAHAAAQVLQRRALRSLAILYVPRGPCLDWTHEATRQRVLSDLKDLADKQKSITIKIDPDLALAYELPDEEAGQNNAAGAAVAEVLAGNSWQISNEQIQFQNTFTLNLSHSEDELLRRMKQKTRYNVRLAGRRGVRIRRGGLQDLDMLYRMYAETSVRDGFVIRKPEYYQDVWGSFIAAGLAQPLIAEVETEPIAGLIVYRFGPKALYMYGMSREVHRDKMPNHLLQWEAIRWAKEQGCVVYDFWGAPNRLDPADPMWGVYRFKRGFGARLERLIGAWDYPNRPILYRLYISLLPRVLDLMRLRGKTQTRQYLES